MVLGFRRRGSGLGARVSVAELGGAQTPKPNIAKNPDAPEKYTLGYPGTLM